MTTLKLGMEQKLYSASLNWLLTHSLSKPLQELQVSHKTQRDTFMAFLPSRRSLSKPLMHRMDGGTVSTGRFKAYSRHGHSQSTLRTQGKNHCCVFYLKKAQRIEAIT